MSKKGNFLFSSLNLRIMVDTVNLLMFGCTLCPASLMLIPWTRIWSITVALISSDITVLCLRWPPWPPRPPLTLNSSSQISIHCRASQTSALWTGLLYMFPHIISHKCDQFWVVVFKWWHLCFNCVWLLSPLLTITQHGCITMEMCWQVVSKQVKSAYGFAKRVIDSISGFRQLSIWFRQ